jgi:hypothetical protein
LFGLSGDFFRHKNREAAEDAAPMPWISTTGTDEKEIREALGELEQASPRAAAIVGAVFVEESLTTLLKSRLRQDQKLLDDMFGPSKPLAAFGSKINLGFIRAVLDAAAELRAAPLR